VAVVSHRAEEAAHLGERRAAGLLHVPEGVRVVPQRLRQPVPDNANLKHHHAHRVGDDVVQLTRDSRALLGNSDACGGFTLPLPVDRSAAAPLTTTTKPMRA
jgi:hypothetical protein